MLNKHTRKGQLREKAKRYADQYGPMGGSHQGVAFAWEDGYRAAIKAVRRAAGKSGIPSRLVKLLRPIR